MESSGGYLLHNKGENERDMFCAFNAAPGDLIFCEEAFAICPETQFIMNKYDHTYASVYNLSSSHRILCFMCCQNLKNSTKQFKCSSCDLVFCSEVCLKRPLHSLECPLIPKGNFLIIVVFAIRQI